MTTESQDRCTILVADDEPAVRHVTTRILERARYRVIEASDGIEAMELLEGSLRVDLVVTDIRMPGMTGTMLAAAMRHRYPGTPFLFISGYADERAEPGLEAAIFLNKPCEPEELLDAVQGLLQRAGTCKT